MKTLRRYRTSLGAFMTFMIVTWQIGSPLNLSAATFYWDSDATASGNSVSGTGLGGTGTWDVGAPAKWWDLTNDVVWPNTNADVAIFTAPYSALPTASTVTLSSGIIANQLSFLRSGYTLTSGTLTLDGTTPTIHTSLGESATIDSQILGSAGLTKTGGGAVRLGNASNTYTGITTISNGSLIIAAQGALGSDASAVVVTGSATRGFGGGSLVLDGTGGSINFTRNLSLQGLGPIADRSAALISVGDNTLSGAVNMAVGNINTRITSANGLLTLSGPLDIAGTAGTTISALGGTNQAGSAQYRLTGALTGTGTLEKSGAGTLFLTPSDTTGFSGSIRVSASVTGTQSSVRITSNNVLGSRTAGTTGAVLDLNAGLLEIRMDDPLVQATGGTNANVYVRGNGSTMFVDHALGGSAVNGAATFGNFSHEDGAGVTFTSRNGYGMSFTTAPVSGADGNSTFTNSLAGLLSFTGNFWSNTDTGGNRSMTIAGNGNTLINGNIIASNSDVGEDHTLIKSGSGILTITGTASTLDGATSVQGGTLAITDFRSLGINNTTSITLGNATTTAGNLIIGTSLAPSATDLVTNRSIVLNGTSASNSIYASQTGSAPVVFNGLITKPVAANTGALVLGGTNTADNTLNTAIPAGTGASTSGLTKVGSGTWVLAAANAYVGATTITNGTLKLKANAAGSNVIPEAGTNTIVFNADATTQSAGGTLEFVGVSGSSTTETLGAFTSTAGMGTVRLTSGGGGAAASLIFTSAAAPGKAGGVNFVTTGAAGGTVTLTGVATTTATSLPGNGHFYFNGADFAVSTGGVMGAPTYSVGGPVFHEAGAGTATLSVGVHNLVSGNITSQGAVGVTSLKMTTHALTMTGNLTVNTGGAANDGGILVTGGTTASISGGGLTTGGAGTLVFRVDGANDVLTLNSPMLVGTTGGFTKNGAGTLILTGNNLQVGATTINEGTVRLSGSGRLSGSSTTTDLALRQGATLDLNGVNSDTAIRSLNGAGTITNGASAATTTLQLGNNNGTGTFTGLITNGTGGGVLNVTKVGTGAQSWLGSSTYTGVTNIGSTGLVTVNTLADIGVASGIGAGSTGNNAGSLVFSGSTGGLVYQGQLLNGSLAVGATSASTNRLFTLSGTGATLSSTAANGNAIVWSNTGAIVHGVVGPQALILTGTSTGDNTFNPQITDSGAGANITSLTKAGAGQWNLGNSNNTYTGATTISDGILGLNVNGALSSGSSLVLGTTTTSGILQMSGTFNRNIAAAAVAGTPSITWGGTTGGGGFAAHTTQLVVTLNNDATTPLVWGTGGFVGTGGTQSLFFGSASALSDVLFQNAINLGTAVRTINVVDNGNTGADFATMSGVLSGTGAAGIKKDGSGVLQLTGANLYTGVTDVFAGTLVVRSLGNSASAAGTATSVGVSGTGTVFDNTNAITLGNGTTGGAILQYVGAGETSDRKIRINITTTGGAQIHADGAGALILTNVANDMALGAKTLSLRGSNTAGNRITSLLADNGGALGVTVDGGATWILTENNTYSGTTTVSAGALGLGSNTAAGIGGNIDLGSGSLFAYGGDRTIANAVRGSNNTGTAIIGDHSLTFSNALQILVSANNYSLTNNLAAGKTLTFAGATANSITTANRAFTVDGSGETFINGDLTTTNTGAGGLVLTKNGNGTLILGGAGGGVNNFNRNNAGITIDRGSLRLAASEVIGHGLDTQGTPVAYGGVTLAPDLLDGDTATLDLNGNTETINALTATTDGTAIIDNTASNAASLIFGANNSTVNFGTGAGTYSITDSGAGALSITKTGSGVATIGGTTGMTTLTYQGATNVIGGTLNIAAVLNGTTSVTVDNGATLNLFNDAGNPLSLSTFSLGTTGGATLGIELGASNALSDTLTASGTASAANTIQFNITDLAGFGSVLSYDLLSAAVGSGLNGATYSIGFAPGGYTYSFNETDTLIQLNLTALAAGNFYWRGDAATQSWSDLAGGNSNFSTTADGLTEAGAAPGALNTVNFSATNAGIAAKSTTLDNPFSIAGLNILNAVAGDVTIASGIGGALSNLTIGTGGIDVQTGAPALTTISAPVVIGAAQTWNVTDAPSTLTVSGALSGTPNLAKSGAGTVILSGDFTAFTGNIAINAGVLNVGRTGTFTVSNLISGAGALTKSAAGIMTLDNNANSFTGPLTITGGTLAYTTIGNVGAGVTSLGAPTTVLNGTISIAGTLSFAGSTSQATDRLITQTGSATYGANGTSGATITYNGAISAGTNAFTLTGTAGSGGVITGGITQTDDAADGTVNGGTWTHQTGTSRVGDQMTATGASTILNLDSGLFQVRNDFTVTTGANLNLNGTGVLSFSTPTLSADASLRVVANGVITLGANNAIVVTDFDGLRVGTDATGVGTLDMVTFNQTVVEFILGNRDDDRSGLVNGTGLLTVTGNLDLYSGTINANLATSAGNTNVLEKISLNTVTLRGDNSGLAGTGATQINEGTLILDYTTSNATKLRVTTALDMRGGNLILNGNAGAGTAQNVASFTLGSGGSNKITLNPGAGQEIVLNLNALTRAVNAQDGTLRLNLPGGTQSATNGVTTDTLNTVGTGANAILGGWLTVNDGTGVFFARNVPNVVDGNIGAAVTTLQNVVGSWATGENISDTTTGFTGTLNKTFINSLRFNAAAGSDVNLTSTGVMGIGSGGILITSNVGGTPSIVNGTLFSGAVASSVPELIITQDSTQTFEIGSDIRINHSVTKTGNGVLRLTGNNVYTGITEIQEGTIEVDGGNGIGDTSIVSLSATRNSTLRLLADETIGRLQGGSRQTDQELGTVAVGTHTLTINNSGANTTYAGFFTGTGEIIKQGTHNLGLSNISSGFTGILTIESGLVTLNNIGQINANLIQINAGGTLDFNNTGLTRSGTRVGDLTTLILNSANGSFQGETIVRGLSMRTDQDTTLDETVGAINLNSGASYVGMQATTTNDDSDIIANNIVRLNGSTLNVRGTNLGGASAQENEFRIGDATNQTAFIANAANLIGGGGSTSQNISIVPWAIGESTAAALAATNMGNSLVTYVSGSGFRPLTFSEYNTFGTQVLATDNIRESLTGALAVASGPAKTINALVLHNASIAAATHVVSGAGGGESLAITSGVMLFTMDPAAVDGNYGITLDGFGNGITVGATNEYIIHVVNPDAGTSAKALTASIASSLTSTADITKSGRGTLILTGNNTAGGNTRKTTINEGTLEIADLDNIGGNTGGLVFAGGTLRLGTTYSGDDLSLRTITLFDGGGTIDTNGISLALANSVGSGVGGLTKTGLGNLTLNAAATYTGATTISAGTLTIGANNATGNGGDLNIGAGATLALGANSITAGLVTTSGASPVITGAGTITASKGFFLNHTGDTTINAVLAGGGGLLKAQTNIVTLTGLNTYTGTTEVQSGTLSFNSITNVNGGASALGNASNAENGIIRMGLTTTATTLNYTGSGHTSDRLIGMQGTTGSVTIDADGTGALGLGGVRFEMAGNKTLILRGSSNPLTIDNSIGGITENGGVLSLTKADANTWELTASNTYTGATSVDEGILRLKAQQNLTGALQFGSINTITTAGSLEVKENATFGSMTVQTNSAINTNNLSIDATRTLTVNGNVTIGSQAALLTTTNLNAVGGGTLRVVNAAAGAQFRVGGANATGNFTTADLSGLSVLQVELNTTDGVFRVNSTSGTNTSGKSTLTLATNNTITAKTLAVGDGGQLVGTDANQVNSLKLGSGTNTFNVDTINIGTGARDFGSVTFNTSTGTLVVRAANGTGRAALNIGTGGATTGVATASGVLNTFDMSGHNADLLFGAVAIGTQGARGDTLTSNFSFNQGTLDMTSLTLSVRTGAIGIGDHDTFTTVNLGGGTVTIGSGILQMAQTATAGNLATATINISGGNVNIGATGGTAINMASAGTGTTATALLNLTGGTTTVNGNIVRAGGAGTSSATITLNGGTLDMTGKTIGTLASAVTFNAQSGTLKNLSELNGGGTLTKTTTGTLILEGTNTYTGATAVNAGTIVARSGTALGNNVSTNDVTVAAGAGLNYAATADTNLNIGGDLTITGGAGTVIGGSIGATAGAGLSSAQINVAGNATTTAAAVSVNIYGINGVAAALGTNVYTLVHGIGGGSDMTLATYSLGTVYNNTDFTVGALSSTSSDLNVGITSATALTTAFWTGGLTGATNVWAASNGTTTSNWTTDAAGTIATPLVPGAGADVIISATAVATAPTATVLGADMSINSLTISDTTNGLGLNADGNTLTIGAGGITVAASVPASTIAAKVALGAGQTWTNNSTNTLTVSGAVSGANALIKDGIGTLALSGANTYSGGTTVTAGVLLANNSTGSATGSGAISVGAAGTLGGTGTVVTTGLTVASLGTLRPGDPSANQGIGTLAVTGNVTLNSGGGSVLDLQITHTNGVNGLYLDNNGNLDWATIIGAQEIVGASDHLNISGDLIVDASNPTTVVISATGSGAFTAGMAWDLVDWGSIVNTASASFSYDFTALNADLALNSLTLDTSQFYLTGYVGVVVPEPSRMLLLMFGLMALIFRRRRSMSMID